MTGAFKYLILGAVLLAPSASWANPHWQRHGNRHHYDNDGWNKHDRGSSGWGHSYNSPRSGGLSQLISGGARSGRLTHSELRAIREEERDLKRKQHAYYADGRLSRRERRDLAEEYRELREEVYEEIQDGERRGGKRRWRR